MFTKKFLKATLEESALAFVLGFCAVMFAPEVEAGWTLALVGGALAAGARAVYGVLVKNLGVDTQAPSVNS